MSRPVPVVGGAIGVFDSGIGGLSVLRYIREQLPQENLIYFADQGHVPYGSRSVVEIRTFSAAITNFLIARGAKVIVVACNTASAAALTYLRDNIPEVPIVGMEPAVKPAAGHTRTGKIGVLATPGTFDSARYAGLLVQYAGEISVLEDPCRGLVELIEQGQFNGPEVEGILHEATGPMLTAGIDTLVLACTHYPFVLPVIRQVVGPEMAIIDPAAAVARQTWKVLQRDLPFSSGKETGQVQIITSSDAKKLASIASQLLETEYSLDQAFWQGDHELLLTTDLDGNRQ